MRFRQEPTLGIFSFDSTKLPMDRGGPTSYNDSIRVLLISIRRFRLMYPIYMIIYYKGNNVNRR